MSALKKFRSEKSLGDAIESVRMVTTGLDSQMTQNSTSFLGGSANSAYSPSPSSSTVQPLTVMPTKLTPLEQQVVDIRAQVPKDVILMVNCGYKVRFFGRDSRIIRRRLGFYSAAPSPFESSSVPVQRALLHASRLLAMGYHVGIVDQMETAAGRAVGGGGGGTASSGSTSGGGSKVFERRLTKVLGLGAAPDLTALQFGGSSNNSSGGGGGSDDAAATAEEGDGNEDGADADDDNIANADATASIGGGGVGSGADDEARFVLFLEEAGEEGVVPATGSTHPQPIGTKRSLHMAVVSVSANMIAEESIVSHNDTNDGPATTEETEDHSSESFVDRCERRLRECVLCYGPVEVVMGREPSSLLGGLLEGLLRPHRGPTDVGFEDTRTVKLTIAAEDTPGYRHQGYQPVASPSSVMTAKTDEAGSEKVAAAPVLSQPSLYALAHRFFSFFGAAQVLQTACRKPFLYREAGAMVLPATTLVALDIMPTTAHGRRKGDPSNNNNQHFSLFDLANRTVTATGARLLRAWLAAPLTSIDAINARQAAVDDIVTRRLCPTQLRAMLLKAKGPDMHTTLARLAAGRCSLYEYRALLLRLEGVRGAVEGLVTSYDRAASTARTSTCGKGDDAADEIPQLLEEALGAIIADDLPQALAAERLYFHTDDTASIPASTLSPAPPPPPPPLEETYLTCLSPLPPSMQVQSDAMAAAEAALEEELCTARTLLKLNTTLQYKTVAGVTHLLEVPASAEKAAPKDWLVISRTKAATRFRTKAIAFHVAARTAAKERLAAAAAEHFRQHQLENYAPMGSNTHATTTTTAVMTDGSLNGSGKKSLRRVVGAVVDAVAVLDVLACFAALAQTPGYTRPRMIPHPNNKTNSSPSASSSSSSLSSSVFALRGLAHPMARCLLPHYVTCDVCFDPADRLWLLTGPNMGGKSALMRSAALCCVLAQSGACVPAADGAVLPIFSSIYCRMGASDALLEGTSTFMVEMRETKAIVAAGDLATSLVILDELGRGTSSYDGLAVADATLRHLLSARAYGFFVTHYHLLADWHASTAGLRLKYMAFATRPAAAAAAAAGESEATCNTAQDLHPHDGRGADGDVVATTHAANTANKTKQQQQQSIVFLFRPVDGVTPSSFGVAVAGMAGIATPILRLAAEKSIEAEAQHAVSRAVNILTSRKIF